MADWEDAPARSTSKGGWEDAPSTRPAPIKGGWEDAPTPAPVVAASAPAQPASALTPPEPSIEELDAKRAAQEAKRKEFSAAEELKKGFGSFIEYGAPSMARQIALQGSADAMISRQKQLALMDRIDKGEFKSFRDVKATPEYQALRESGENLIAVNSYFANRNQPEVAGKLRASTERTFNQMATDTRAQIDILNKYARENKKKYGPRVENFTDIDWTSPQVAADFTNWASYNLGAGGPQLAATMLAAITLKKPGVFAIGAPMGVSQAVSNRLKFVQDKVKDLPPEQQGEAIAKYIADTGDANLITGVLSGSLDLLLGPAARATKLSLTKGTGQVGKVAAMKEAAKKAPRDMLEEAISGGSQEAIQIAAKKVLEEEGKPITMQNIKDVINAMASEGIVAPIGTGANVALAGLTTPSAPRAQPKPKTEAEAEKVEPTFTVDEATGKAAPKKGKKGKKAKAEAPVEEGLGAVGEMVPGAPTAEPTELGPIGEVVPGETAAAPVAPAAEEEAAPPVPYEAERQAKIQALTDRLVSRGFDKTEARQAATLRVETEERELEARKQEAAGELPTYYPKVPKSQMSVEEQLFQEFLDKGVPPEQARAMAVAEAEKRKEDSKTAAQQARNIKKAKKDATGPVPPAVGTSTEVSGRPEQTVATAGTEGTQRDGVVSAEPDVRGPDVREEQQPATVAAEDADLEARKAKAANIAKINFNTALDQVNSDDYNGDLDAALDAYRVNMLDTLDEEGETHQYVVGRAEREFDRLVAEHKATKGEPSGTETAQAQQAETQGQEAAPAAAVTEPAPKAKRGRKPLPEEKRQKTKEEQDRVEAIKTKADYELRKGKNSLTAMIDNALAPVDEELTAEEAEKAEDDKRDNKRYAVRRLLELAAMPEIRGTAVAKRINALLNDRSKISEQEVKDAKKGIEVAKQALADKSSVLGPMVEVQGGTRTASRGASESRKSKPRTVNKQLTGTMTGSQALSIIAKTGTWFQKLLANRLRKFLTNVKVVVLEKGDPLPQQLIDMGESPEGRWNGLFVPGTQPTVYIVGASFGQYNGQNNITLLHELLHAALNGRLYAGMGNMSREAKVFTDTIIRLMERAAQVYGELDKRDAVPEALRTRVEATLVRDDETGELSYEIFESPDEFLSYALTEDAMQEFLKAIPSIMVERAASAFSDFVKSAAKVLGLNSNNKIETNALTDLIEATDSLLEAPMKEGLLDAINEYFEESGEALASTPPEKQKPGQFSATANKDTRTPAELKKDVQTALHKIETTRTVEEMAEASAVANIKADPANFVPELMSLYDVADNTVKSALLNLATTDYLAQEWGGSQIPRLKETNRLIQEMHGMASKLMEGANKVSNVIFNEFYKDSDIRTPTENMALAATLAEIDPSTDRRSPTMNAMWDKLPAAGKKVYTLIRDFYEDMSAMHSKLLNDQVDNLSLASDIKQNLLTKIKAIYEVGDKVVPYFALVRRGDYWLRVGEGKDRQFYMFTSALARDRAARGIAKQARVPLSELESRREIERGNDVSSLRATFSPDSPMLTELFDFVDAVTLAGLTAEDAANVKSDLKDAIYQLYLISMPEQRLRKQFIHREGIAGFSTDLMQNFSDSAVGLTMQLSRIKYAPQVRSSMSAARDSVLGQPKLEPFIKEMEDRVALELNGGRPATKLQRFAEPVVNFLNRGAFVHFLSAASSALLQPLSIVQFGLPILGARYGYTEVGKEFMNALRVWNTYGISTPNADGSMSYHMPTMRSAKGLTPLERKAMDALFGRNIASATLTSELLARRTVTSDKSLSAARRYLGNTWWFASGGMLMHSAERMAQEMLGLMSFRLNSRKATKEFMKSVQYKTATNKIAALRDFQNANFQKWIDRAVMDTYESVGNMTQQNRPPIMRNYIGSLLTQFLMFPLHNNILLGKNFKRMIAPLPNQTRTEAAKIFFGIMGTTALMAGTLGLGIGLTIFGFLSGMWDDWWAEEEKKRGNRPETLRDMSFTDWYKAVWLPNVIGGFIDKGTEEGRKTIQQLTNLIARGGLNAATGADFSSRIGVLNLGSRDLREGRSVRESVGLTVESLYPPFVEQYIGYIEAFNLLGKGYSREAAEKALPANARSLVLAYKWGEEGAKTGKGVSLQSPDSFKKGELIWRAVGFNSDKLADAQSTNYRINQIDKNIETERNSILADWKKADQTGNFKADMDTNKKANEFNRKYPSYRITASTKAEAIRAAREARGMSFKGVEVTKKNAPFAVEAIGPSRRALLEAEREAAQKKTP